MAMAMAMGRFAFLLCLFLSRQLANGLKPSSLSRREALRQAAELGRGASAAVAASGSILSRTFGLPSPAAAAESSKTEAGLEAANTPAAKLRAMIPSNEFGGPATNATIAPALAQIIEDQASKLEALTRRNNVRDVVLSPELSGSWRLLYSNGPEIVNLAGKLPLGFFLGPTYQPIDTSLGYFENRAVLDNKYGWAKAETNVVGDLRISEMGSKNAVGVVNDRNNRVAVDFRCIVFKLSAFGQPIATKKIIPKLDPGVDAEPANDVTYLGDDLKIVRGGDGALFVFEKAQASLLDTENPPMLTALERDDLFRDGFQKTKNNDLISNNSNSKNTVLVGGKKEFLKGSPELGFLFRDTPATEGP